MHLLSQPVPAEVENIPQLMTFGPKAEKSWGDDLYPQIFFFFVPESYKGSSFTQSQKEYRRQELNCVLKIHDDPFYISYIILCSFRI